jgi:hypothetical protein
MKGFDAVNWPESEFRATRQIISVDALGFAGLLANAVMIRDEFNVREASLPANLEPDQIQFWRAF